MKGDSRAQRRQGQRVLDDLAADFEDLAGVDRSSMFGSRCLRVHGKVFAFVGAEGELVVKLPADRASELVEAGAATRTRIGRNQAREWVGVPHRESDPDEWRGLLDESYGYLSQLHGG